MKKTIPLLLLLVALGGTSLSFLMLSSNAQVPPTTVPQNDEIAWSGLLKTEDYGLKPFHHKLQLTCSNCHGQGEEATYTSLSTAECLTCHGSAEKVASRTGFMDANQTNPHRSLHDGLDLDCYECHAEHKPSPSNLCQTCHDNTSDWFGATP